MDITRAFLKLNAFFNIKYSEEFFYQNLIDNVWNFYQIFALGKSLIVSIK
jgi:hypothetical protein